ncbi:MAG TPA: alpha/beta hydrolase [Acidobacteriaceae bacterium]|jgi:pimeloyl-ACP methyl ester carboxylesterase|nr:alpha/beta hydrolase [Acidobacteriaceae bacterium]
MRYLVRRRIGTIIFALLALGALASLAVLVYPVWVGEETARLALWRKGIKSESVVIDGNRIHYFEAIPRSSGEKTQTEAVPVLLIHGLGGRAEDWTAFLPALAAQGYHVYAPDLLGYGISAQPKDAAYSVSEEEAVIAKFMASRGITQADVVGWSMGGWITMRLALDHPRSVRRVVLIDSAGIYFHPGMPLSLFAPETEDELDELFHYLEPGNRTLPYFVRRDALSHLKARAWVVNRSINSMMSGTDLLDFRLGGLQQPVLIEWGASDRLITTDVGRRLHTLIPQSQYVEFPGCGHLVPVECSAEALPPVEDFFAAK